MRSFLSFLLNENTQTYIGNASEGTAALSLMMRHVHPKHQDSEVNNASKERALGLLNKAKEKLSPEEYSNRTEHGHAMADAIHEHLKKAYPEHEISEVHVTNQNGDIAKATKGKHKDTNNDNPSDILAGLKHKKTGEMIYHGFSLKSTQGSGDIGFKNPTPNHMDRELGTHVMKMHADAQKELEDRKPELKGLPYKSTSGQSKATIIKSNPEVKKAAKEVADKHYSKIRDHIVDHLSSVISSGEEGHEKVKRFLRNNYLNTGTNTMPYTKITAMGTAKKGVKTKAEEVGESKAASLLSNPKTKIQVSKGGGNSYIHYHATDPDTGKRHHLFSEQVKTSSGFGYSTARHNIQPPGKNT